MKLFITPTNMQNSQWDKSNFEGKFVLIFIGTYALKKKIYLILKVGQKYCTLSKGQ